MSGRTDPELIEQLPADVLSHVLHQFGLGGWEAGDFTKDLITLIQRADPENQARLERGFPHYVWAVQLIQEDTTGQAAELMQQRVGAAAAALRSEG